jgi:hypothetical protein
MNAVVPALASSLNSDFHSFFGTGGTFRLIPARLLGRRHASHCVSYGNDWCSKPVLITAGTEPVEVRFVMDHKEANCEIDEIDGLRK